MDRTLAVGATSGSLSALLLRVLSDSLNPSLTPFECPVCPDFLHLVPWKLDITSLLLGISIGLALGPLVELLYLLRQSWRFWIQTRLLRLAKQQNLYRLG